MHYSEFNVAVSKISKHKKKKHRQLYSLCQRMGDGWCYGSTYNYSFLKYLNTTNPCHFVLITVTYYLSISPSVETIMLFVRSHSLTV